MIRRAIRLTTVLLTLFFAIAGTMHMTGQESSAPSDSGGCTATPLTDDEISTIRSTPESTTRTIPSSIGSDLLATGDPADEALSTTLTGIVEQYVACTNAGNTAAVMALGTDSFVRGNSSPGTPDRDVMATPGVAPASDRTIELIEIDPVLTFSNGTAAAFATANPVGASREVLIFLFVQEGEDWKIDAIVRDETFQAGEDFPAEAVPATPGG